MREKLSKVAKVQGTKTPAVFSYGSSTLRTINENGIDWFMAQDVCSILGLSDTGKALSKLDEDEKLTRKFFGSGQSRYAYFINESGMYNLIFRSNKPEAKAFRKWVTSEVLPAIRQSGAYQVPQPADVALTHAIQEALPATAALAKPLLSLADNIGRVSSQYRRTALLRDLNRLKTCLSLS